MPTEIKYGVVVDNNDIHETGKIRVLLLEQDLPLDYRNKSVIELKKLLANLDAKGNYVPWQKATITKTADPYLADSFLPKQLNLIPEEGQLVKIIIYGEAMYREYVGPQISSLENQKEGYVNSLNSYRTASKKDLIKNGYVNKVSDFAIYWNNSQIVFSEKELFLRTNSQDYQTKRKNTGLTLLQQSTFNNTLTVDRVKKNVIQEPEKLISHLLELTIEKKVREVISEKTIQAKIKLISLLDHKNLSGKTGVTNFTYQEDELYTDGVTEVEFDLVTDDINDVQTFLDSLRLNLLDKKISDLAKLTQNGSVYETTITTPTYVVTVTDHRTMTRSFSEITDRKEVEIISFVTRFNPEQTFFETTEEALELLGVSAQYITTNPKFYAKEKSNLDGINTLINKYLGNATVESKLMNEAPRVVEVEESNPKLEPKIDSYSVQASNKLLLLSTQVDPNLISSNPTQNGLTQKELVELTDPSKLNTFSTVRGEMMLQLLIRLIDLFLSHGHSTGNTVKNSLEDETRSELSKIKEQLIKRVNSDLSGGPDLLNQYIRLN